MDVLGIFVQVNSCDPIIGQAMYRNDIRLFSAARSDKVAIMLTTILETVIYNDEQNVEPVSLNVH